MRFDCASLLQLIKENSGLLKVLKLSRDKEASFLSRLLAASATDWGRRASPRLNPLGELLWAPAASQERSRGRRG